MTNWSDDEDETEGMELWAKTDVETERRPGMASASRSLAGSETAGRLADMEASDSPRTVNAGAYE